MSALTHGYYFVFTAPTWALFSAVAIVPVAADRGTRATASGDLAALHVYARFPQGMPPSYRTRARRVRRSGEIEE